MSTCLPDATSRQPRSWTGVGSAKEARNQSRTGGEKRSRESATVPTLSSLTSSWSANKCSLQAHIPPPALCATSPLAWGGVRGAHYSGEEFCVTVVADGV